MSIVMEANPLSTEQMNLLKKLVATLDLTCLDGRTEPSTVDALAKQANTPLGPVAALCVYSWFLSPLREVLADSPIRIATVANFPGGELGEAVVAKQIEEALRAGAQEIDVVFPYQSYLQGREKEALQVIKTCVDLCHPQAIIKIILETAAFSEEKSLEAACFSLIDLNVDFLKTSTGKRKPGATPDAANIILKTIQTSQANTGFKVSGGIRTIDQALEYVNLTKHYLGENAITPQRFRIGASQLLDEIVATLD